MTTDSDRVAGSYRDPKGYVLNRAGRIYRVVTPVGQSDFQFLRPFMKDAANAGFLIETWETDKADTQGIGSHSDLVIEHKLIPYVSYPYEWGFAQLRMAALHHLKFQLWLLDRDATLSDASAYNIQFVGSKTIFIDVLSIIPYQQGSYWTGYRQFCEQFLNPLLLRSRTGIAHNAWYRGALEGIPTEDLSAILSLRDKLSFNMLIHVVLHGRLQQRARQAPSDAVKKARKGKGLSRTAYRGMLTSLRNWITRMEPRGGAVTTWGEYAAHNTYRPEEAVQKADVVAEFVKRNALTRVMDLGCNTGDYSVAALDAGASEVIGFDFDQNTVDRAFDRSKSHGLGFLPLYLDAANPSPDQGWRQDERTGFAARAKANGLLALAFEHHLAIGRNVPLDQVVEWLVSLAPRGLIEFVPKSDPTVQMMLALRADIFADYDEATFRAALEGHATVVNTTIISGSGRVLYEYAR